MTDNLKGNAAYNSIIDNIRNNTKFNNILLTIDDGLGSILINADIKQTEACVKQEAMVTKLITYGGDKLYFYIVFNSRVTQITKNQYDYAVSKWNPVRELAYKSIW